MLHPVSRGADRRFLATALAALAIVTAGCFLAGPSHAEEAPFRFTPDAVAYDPAVPTLESVVGHAFGDRISNHAETTSYLRALAAASDRVTLFEYGESWEGRSLVYVAVASAENSARLEEIRSGMKRLSDPRTLEAGEAKALVAELPTIAWMSYCVHGDEASGTDAGLFLAYHLAAAEDCPVAKTILANTVVLIDPIQNPDGRERFIHYNRTTRGRWPDADPQSAEHRQPWPGGRTNHYLFDMNRDWFALTQPESSARVRAYLEWMPQVFADIHEMGGDSSYYFPPPAQPINPNMKSTLIEWTGDFGRNNARWFDRMGFDYFTREVFDSFFPGYGESWPLFQGAVGMTFEMAGTGGLVRKRSDERTQHYRDAVQRHFIASLSTCETAAVHRERLLTDYHRLRALTIDEGRNGSVRGYLLPRGDDPGRTDGMIALLMKQGIEVHRTTAPLSHSRLRSHANPDSLSRRTVPAGTYVILAAQPSKNLLKTLLDRHTDMDPDFFEKQKDRIAEHRGHQLYDVTGWSLPYLFDVPCHAMEGPIDPGLEGSLERLTEPPMTPGGVESDRRAEVAYLIPWGSHAAVRALVRLFEAKARVLTAGRSFTIGKQEYAPGTLIVKVRDNESLDTDLHDLMTELGTELGLTIHATDTSWVDDGVNFGSGNVHYLKAPRVALLWGSPTSSNSAGATRYLLEQRFDMPVTLLPAERAGSADLERYHAIVLPSSRGYGSALGERGAQHLRRWVNRGGTLIALGSASRWLTDEKVGFLPVEPEKKPKPAESPKKEKAFDLEAAIRPETEWPTSIPGAVLRVDLDDEHWLAHGYDGDAYVVADARAIYTPIRINQGTNVGVFAKRDRLVASGYGWDATLDQIAQKPFLIHRPLGRGHVIAFTEDPTFRASIDGLNGLLMNALLFGPSY